MLTMWWIKMQQHRVNILWGGGVKGYTGIPSGKIERGGG